MKNHVLPTRLSVFRKTLSVALPFVACATLSHAAVLLQENFDNLNAGALSGDNSNGWTAVSGVNVAAGGISYSNGAITINGGANRVESTLLSGGTGSPLATKGFAAQSGEVWFSFTLRVDSSANNSRYWFWVSDTTDINTGATGTVANSNTANRTIFSEIRINTSVSSTSVVSSAVDDQTYFFVAKLSKNGNATNADAYDQMEVWLNPNSTTLTGGIVANGHINAGTTGGIANFGLTTLTTAADIQWDNLLVGTSQADVLNVYAIPEPSAFAAYGGFAAISFAALRRRRD